MRSKSTIWKIIGFLILLAVVVAVIIRGNYYEKVYVRLLDAGFFHQEVPLEELKAGPGTMIALTFGQSNASNSGETLYSPHNAVLNYAKDHLYEAKDPMMGTSGIGGSVWGILGDKLLDSALFKKVVFIPIGIGSTNISCWSDSLCNEKLVNTLKALEKHKIKLSHIFWHQGEADGNTTKEAYRNSLEKILLTIRKYHQDAPFYCSLVSFNGIGINPQILEAQQEFITAHKDVFVGAQTDAISGAGDRYQVLHFTYQGMRKYADSWYKAIQNRVE